MEGEKLEDFVRLLFVFTELQGSFKYLVNRHVGLREQKDLKSEHKMNTK